MIALRDALGAAAAPWNFASAVVTAAEKALTQVQEAWHERDSQALAISAKVSRAFTRARITEAHFAGTTGYGYHDAGREAYERLLADVFGAEAALVRLQFASGTHAIVAAVRALLGEAGQLVSLTGPPYDTLRTAWGLLTTAADGAPRRYREAVWQSGSLPEADSLAEILRAQPAVVFIQRSRGYAPRPALTIAQLEQLIDRARQISPAATIVVDNCYGEFVERQEPCEIGADVSVGSLIKNPGGGVAPGGAYVVGRSALLERIADAVFAPGLGRKVGPTYDALRAIFAGLHRAPRTVAESLKILDFAAGLFRALGFEVDPQPGGIRADIIQAIRLGSRARLIAFAEGLQSVLPVNAHVRPEPGEVPGYSDHVVMALGGFVAGSTMELSCDAPLREPFEVYVQGGMDIAHGMLACMSAANRVLGMEGQAGRRENIP